MPFSFIPASGSGPDSKPGPISTRVRAIEDRIACEITFPAAIVSEAEEHRLGRFEAMRPQQVAFLLAKRLLDRYVHAADQDGQPGAERP